MLKPREYQKEGISFLSDKRFALLADDPGIGKSMQAILALVKVGATKILVICPAQVKYNWQREFEKWAPGQFSIGIIDTSRQEIPKTNVVIVNYDLVIRKTLFDKLYAKTFDCIINDESHRLKNPKSLRTKKVMGKWGLVNRTKQMWFLTGTPVTSRPIDLYPMVARCMAAKFAPHNKYLSYAYRYCGAYQSQFGLIVTGATHLKELNQKMEGFLLRRRKQDVLKELPRRIITNIEFDCPKDIRQIIAREEEDTLAQADGRDPEHFQLGEISRIRQAIAKYKMKDCAGFIEDRLEEDKVVVFFYHKSVCKFLKERFKKYKPLVIDGSVPAKKRMALVDDFMTKPEHRIFLGQMEAAGEGIDGLQHASSTCVFVEPSWLPKDIDQCISRLERMGQKNPVNAYILTIKDTIEAKMMKLLEWKLQNINVILNDNQTLKTTKKKENKMAKKMYLEDKIDLLLEGQAIILKTLAAIVVKPTVAVDPAVEGGDRTTEVEAPEGTPVDDPENVTDAEVVVTSSEVRSLAGKITKADPIKGKTTCIKIIESVVGKGKKLADANDAQLAEIGTQFLEVLSA
ncbi:MAG: DEAD/DEAH box helicase [Deltaproteobacteria bacterium]|nr:DEAD/DEAH box helicase [Deltaproteobacteria bacterium]